MNEGKRAYNILRGYVGREWDRLKDVDYESAQKELDDALSRPRPATTTEDGVEYKVVTRQLSDEEKPDYARKLLGVAPTASFSEIRKKFESLNQRADPNNFAEGSVEREQARIIQRRVVWAYQILTENLDGTEKRFRSLEID